MSLNYDSGPVPVAQRVQGDHQMTWLDVVPGFRLRGCDHTRLATHQGIDLLIDRKGDLRDGFEAGRMSVSFRKLAGDGQMVGDLTGTTMQAEPFRGAAPALTEVVSGRLDLFLSPTGPAIPLASSNQIRLLAVTSTSRLGVAPEVPTFTELGYPLNLYGWIGICAANGTPSAAIQRLNRELTAVVGAPEYRSRIEATGQIPEASSTEELQRILGRMSEEVSGLVTKYGIRVE